MLQQGAKLSEDEIKDYVKDNLASYKVPREVVFLDELPRNPTGKVLKRELRSRRRRTGPSDDKDADGRQGDGEDLAGMGLEEAEHPAPGVLAGLRVILEAPVEERVRGARVHVDLVVEAGLGEARVELLDLVDRDPLVGAAEQAEERRADVAGALERPVDAEPFAREHAVEADHGREVGHVRAGQERLEPAEAEPDRGDRRAPVRSRSAAIAAAASCCTPGTVSCWTCGMYSNSSSRGPRPAVRPK